ncbi:hypothetical protein ACWGJP_04955 [Microbacterium sp. NPDC055903]
MIITDFPRDLLMTGVIFGIAAFVWSGWAQERPPKHWIWRVVLAAIGLGGATLAGINLPTVIRNWDAPTAIAFGGTASVIYLVVFWLEVIAIIVLAIVATRRKRQDLIPVLVLAVVGIHFLPLAWVFGQPIFFVTGVLVTAVAVLAVFLPDDKAARSFWCGALGGAVLLVSGAICAIAGFAGLG